MGQLEPTQAQGSEAKVPNNAGLGCVSTFKCEETWVSLAEESFFLVRGCLVFLWTYRALWSLPLVPLQSLQLGVGQDEWGRSGGWLGV